MTDQPLEMNFFISFILNLAFFLIGFAIILVECIVLLRRRRFRKRAIQAQGKIVRRTSNKRSDFPVVEFQAKNGENYHVQSSLGTLHKIFMPIGRAKTVYYDPQNPDKAVIAMGWMGYLTLVLLAVFGIYFIYFSFRDVLFFLSLYLLY